MTTTSAVAGRVLGLGSSVRVPAIRRDPLRVRRYPFFFFPFTEIVIHPIMGRKVLWVQVQREPRGSVAAATGWPLWKPDQARDGEPNTVILEAGTHVESFAVKPTALLL